MQRLNRTWFRSCVVSPIQRTFTTMKPDVRSRITFANQQVSDIRVLQKYFSYDVTIIFTANHFASLAAQDAANALERLEDFAVGDDERAALLTEIKSAVDRVETASVAVDRVCDQTSDVITDVLMNAGVEVAVHTLAAAIVTLDDAQRICNLAATKR